MKGIYTIGAPVMEYPGGDPLGAQSLARAEVRLASRCAEGDVAALAELEAAHFDALLRLLPAGVDADDFLQRLRIHLFASEPGRRPNIAEFDGRGSLRSWLKVTALRCALNERRRGWRETPSEGEAWLAAVDEAESQELTLIQQQSMAELKSSFEAAARRLSARERNLLRLRFSERLEVEQIGALFKVHRVTVARWLASARERLVQSAKSELVNRLHLADTSFDEVLALVRSQLDLSLSRILVSNSDEPHQGR